MYYYQFNIGDYASATQHLDDTEDLAYRRMLDLYYSKEKPLPLDVKDIARLIRMRTHSDSIANVLSDFFTQKKDGYHCMRVDKEISAFKGKSDKARASAKARWNKNKDLADNKRNANASETQSDSNANHKPLTNNQEPVKENKPIVDKSPEFNFRNEFILLGVKKNFIDQWLKVRKNKRATNSELAFKKLVTEMSKSGLTFNDAVKTSVENSWSGFNTDWITKPVNQQNDILEQSANSDWHLVENKGF